MSSPAKEISVIPPLHDAIRSNETEFIEKLFQFNFVQDINITDKLGFTALHIAVFEKNVKVTETLLKHGAKVNVHSNEKQLLQEVEALTDRKLNDFDAVVEDDRWGYVNLTPLHIAALSGSEEIVKTLIEYGADVNRENNEKSQVLPLQCAVESGSVEIISIIHQNGAKFGQDSRDELFKYMNDFEKMFWFAAAYGKIEIMKHLLESGTNDIKFPGKYGIMAKSGASALYYAAMNGYEESVKILIQCGIDFRSFNYEFAPIHMASLYGHSKVVKILLNNGVDVDEQNKFFQSPLLSASCEGHYEVAKMLIQNGAEVNKHPRYDLFEEYAIQLHTTIYRGYWDIAELLVCSGADLDNKSHQHDNNTPLHLALQYDYQDHSSLIGALIEKGANTEIMNEDGNTPLEAAMRFGPNNIKTLLYCKHNMP